MAIRYRFLLAAVLAACSFLSHSPVAKADLADDFLQELESWPNAAGVWDDDPDRALEVAKTACSLSASGYRQNQIANSLISENADKSANAIATTIAVGKLMFCPAALDRP